MTNSKLNKNRPGYKKTKAGWIPEEWDIKPLGLIGSFSKGKGISNSDKKEEGIPCITYGEIYTTHNYVINDFYSFIDIETAKKSQRINENDVLFAGSGETLDEIGKCVAFTKNVKAYAGGDIVIFHPENVNSIFLSYTLNSDFITRYRRKLGQGHSIVHIYSSGLKTLHIPLPPFSEQKKIAEILSAWDRAIEQVGMLIETKEMRYRGLLNDLINKASAKHGWKKVRLGELFQEVTEKIGKRDIPPFSISAGIGFVSQREKWGKDIAGKQYQNYVRLQKGEFAYNKGNSKKYKCGCAYLLKGYDEIAVPNVFISFRRKNKALCSEFYEHYFIADYPARELKKYITSSARSDGLLNLNKSNFFKIFVPCPSSHRQNLIANVLTASQHEINILKKLADTYQKQKRGLMQKLLTGNIRVKV